MENTATRDIRGALIYWAITVCYMWLIYFVSSRNNIRIPELTIGFDKVLHACAYMFLGFLSYISMNKSGVKKYVFITAFLFAGIYAVSDELHQSYVPGRDASIGDLIADFTGILIGCLGARFIKSKINLF